jgi:hypothetical protein
MVARRDVLRCMSLLPEAVSTFSLLREAGRSCCEIGEVKQTKCAKLTTLVCRTGARGCDGLLKSLQQNGQAGGEETSETSKRRSRL